MPVFCRGNESDSFRSRNRALVQSIGQAGYHADVRHLTAGREYDLQHDGSSDLILARLFSVGRFRLLQNPRFLSDVFAAKHTTVIATTGSTRPASAWVAVTTAHITSITGTITATGTRAHAAASAVSHAIARAGPRGRSHILRLSETIVELSKV